jgi:hypothetical protein
MEPVDVRVSAISGTLLIEVSGAALGSAEVSRLREHIDRAGGGERPIVVDLSRVGGIERDALEMLREAWRGLGDRLRVVAPPASQVLEALKHARLRRFAVHGTLSGALAQVGGG